MLEKMYEIEHHSKRYSVAKCKNCGFVFVNPQPSLKELSEYYNGLYKIPIETIKISQTNKAKYVSKIIKNLKKGNLLEVGCSYGFLINNLHKNGWNVEGIEISKEASDYARNILGLDVFTGKIEEYNPKEKFDVIIMMDVLEHLTDPKQ